MKTAGGAGAAAALLTVFAGALVSCRDSSVVGPPVTSIATRAPEELPFYFYQGEKLYLNVDSSGFVIASESNDPIADLGDELSGLAAGTPVRLSQLPGHWVVTVSGMPNGSAYRAALARLRASRRLRFASSLYRVATDGSPVTLTGRLAVRFKTGVPRSAIDTVFATLGVRVLREPQPDSGWFYFVLGYPKNGDPLAVAASLDRSPLAEWASPDMISNRRLQSEPYFGYQYYLRNTATLNGARVDVNVEPAWRVTLGTWNIKVVVVDDGVDQLQADWAYWCGMPFVWAYDAFLNQFWDTPTNPHANDRHGTAVAGLINGCHNSVGIAGIAPGISIGIVRIFRDDSVATDQGIADGINWAWATAGADVISNSWAGGTPNYLVTDAISKATTYGRGGKGSVVVFSAGNTSDRDHGIIGPVLWPATLANVIAVGAINGTGQPTNYTPEGTALDIVSPSSHAVPSQFDPPCSVGDVLTTDRGGPIGCNDGPGGDVNYTFRFGGTSAAAPQVSAAAALLLTVDPTLTRQQVTSLLLDQADRGGTWANTSQFGRGKLNIERSMAQIATIPPPPPPPLVAYVSGTSVVTRKGTYTWTANPSGGVGGYTYQWSVYYPGWGQTYQLGTGQSQQLLVYAGDGTFEMRVVVRSGSATETATMTVVECIGGGDCYN